MRMQLMRWLGREGGTPNRNPVILACIQGGREGGTPPNCNMRTFAHGMQDTERRGGTPDQEGVKGAPPKQCALPVHVIHERDGGSSPEQEGEGGASP